MQVFTVDHERAATAPMQEAFEPMDPLGVVGTLTLELGTSSSDELRARFTGCPAAWEHCLVEDAAFRDVPSLNREALPGKRC